MKLGDRVAPYRGTRFTEGLLYLRRRRLKVRIHGRPRSDRKRRFLLSAVAPSTSTRHPREAKPINWAQRGGLACRPGNCVLTPRPHFTAPSCTLGNRVVGASDGAPFRQERRPTPICRPPGAGSGPLAEARPKCLPASVPNLVVSFAWTGIPADSR